MEHGVPPPIEPAAGRDAGRERRRSLSIVLFAFGLLLLAAAIWLVVRQGETLATAWRTAQTAPVWMLVLMALLPLVNWMMSSLIFWIITNRFGRVGYWEMSALLGSAWLLNMLPMKPGLIGRVAYHRAISGITVPTSLWALGLAFGSGLAGILLALGLSLPISRPWVAGAAGLVLVASLAARVRAGPSAPGSRGDLLARCTLAAIVRAADTYVWAIRYALVFKLSGVGGLEPGSIVAVAAISQIAGQFPVQFGLREWVVGLVSAAAGTAQAAGIAAVAPGVTADLINRGCEVACALPVGLICSGWVFRRLRQVPQALSTTG